MDIQGFRGTAAILTRKNMTSLYCIHLQDLYRKYFLAMNLFLNQILSDNVSVDLDLNVNVK